MNETTSTVSRLGSALVFAAAATGLAVGVLAIVPLAHLVRHWLGLPEPTAVPLDGPVDRPLTPTYWAPWLIGWILLVVPGIAMMHPARFRLAGLAYLVAVGGSAGAIAILAAWMDYGLG